MSVREHIRSQHIDPVDKLVALVSVQVKHNYINKYTYMFFPFFWYCLSSEWRLDVND